MDKFSKLLESGKYSDFKIKCGSKEWLVHRAIICPQSEFFTRICDSNFKEGVNSELDLSADDPDHIEQMLHFLYSGQYNDLASDDPNSDSSPARTGKLTAETRKLFMYILDSYGTHPNAPGNDEDEEESEDEESEDEGSDDELEDDELEDDEPEDDESEDDESDSEDEGHPIAGRWGIGGIPRPRDASGASDQGSVQQSSPIPVDITGLLHHVAMYALGDRYFINDLKLLSAFRFACCLPEKWDHSLWAVVEEIDNNTSPDDGTLQDPIIKLCLRDSVRLLSDATFREKLTSFPAMELPLLRKHCLQANEQIDELKELPAIIKTLRAEVKIRGSDVQYLNAKLSAVKKTVRDKILPLTANWSGCRHCGVAFNSILEEHRSIESNVIVLFLRCKKCGAKHHRGGNGDRVEW
ncbi:hypothetical protein Dda_8722 [Drechslerella dactyloides]|uniref:BTB domain-containing protein n=1 Tax=Drechslerella dactyloides TaxID=74499 RepID=A0AAD6NHK0_DREDA|nr:hypothetical protein Dda_8722 [Drechslerella dactyloides]